MSDDVTLNKERIAKNTALLYVRMFLTLIVGLYTSRVVLNTLGVSDYGVYNVVAGMVTMLAFLNTAMATASQRFIAYELGKGNTDKLKAVFSTSVNIHFLIALIILFFAETIGLWFVNTHLNIDPERMTAANWVYQFAIFTFMLTVLSVPYNACIIAHEHMKAFAYISILEAVLKLGIAFCLLIGPFDKLILYGFLVFIVALIIRVSYGVYCRRHFEESNYRFVFDKGLFKEMFSFAGWSMVGNLGFSFKDQLSNIILNIFYGTTVNAARGIAMQVSGVVTSFLSNFGMALNPQITKQYAAGHLEESRDLVYLGVRYSFYLLSLIAVPVLINIDYLLKIWLGNVPEYTSIFAIFAILSTLLASLSGAATTAIQATGHIRTFQIGLSIIMLLEIPVDYILLKMGFPPYSVMYPTMVSYTVATFFRFYLLKRMMSIYDLKYYTLKVFLRCVAIFAIAFIASYYLKSLFTDSFLTLVFTTLISLCITSLLILAFGMKPKERRTTLERIKFWISKGKNK